DGFVDAAVVSAAALGLDRPALAVELGLHHLAVTQLDFAGQIRRRRVASSQRGGLLDLYQQWLTLLGEIFVKRTRFDPLHDAASEQRLFDLLPDLTAEAARSGNATAVLDSRERRLEVPVSCDQLAEAARPIYRQILTLLHALRPAGAPIALLLPQALVELPGWRPLLSEFSGCELILLGDSFAGCALSVLDLPATPATQAVPLLRRLPAQPHESAVLFADRELIERDAQRSQPTHILVGARTVTLGRQPLVVGRALAETDSISLPEGLAGVSRRHCTFVRERDAVVLIDHSRCGTFVNGERVTERVRVHAGDRVRLGEPGIELALIAVDALPGTSHASPAN
ncbi:MAG TPA: FHA domain-containing protein, partial [Polyangiales bacterium]|nr:FHA domain-containing protein [Polyangiales bacterium]